MEGTGSAEVAPSQKPSRPKAAKTRPSARPARLMIGAGAVAALTVIGAGLVRFPAASDDSGTAAVQASSDEATTGGTDEARAKRQDKVKRKGKATTERPVKYVRLKPGQKAPKGARVIREAAPTPRIVVRRSSPATQRSSPQVVTKTRQSG